MAACGMWVYTYVCAVANSPAHASRVWHRLFSPVTCALCSDACLVRVHVSAPDVCIVPLCLVLPTQVRYLKIIEKSGYQALPWVRYITQGGDYQLRTS